MQLSLARFGFLSLKKSPPLKTLEQCKELRIPKTVSHVASSATDDGTGVSLDLETEPGSRASQQSLPYEEKHLEHDSCAVRVIEFAPSAQPRKKLSGQEVLEQALGPESKVRKTIIKRGEAILTGEIFCFYAAILKWEQLVKDSQTTQRNRKKIETDAKRIIALFVAPNAPYENGCLSGQTKVRLLMMGNLAGTRSSNSGGRTLRDLHNVLFDQRFFADAKEELRRDILGNPVLKRIVQEELSYQSQCDFR
jgi:hypothetical protein